MRNVSHLLDHTRWVAALLVAAGHLRGFLMVDWSAQTHHTLATALFYWMTGFGRMAVIVFFVLSGYLVGGRAFAAIEAGRFNLQSYALNRFSRLYPPLLAAIALTALLDTVGLRYCNSLGFYDYPNSYHLVGEFQPVAETLTARGALFNLLFLQTIVAPTFGSDSPLWSLANEFWYYAFCPLIALLPRGRPWAVLASVPVLVAVGGWFGLEIVALGATWVAGALAYRYARPRPAAIVLGVLVIFLLVAAAARTARGVAGMDLTYDLAIAASFAAVLWAAGKPSSDEPSGPQRGLAARLAGFSYTLYLVHVPVCFLFTAALLQHYGSSQRLQPQPAVYALYAVGLGLAILVAFLVSRFTEARTGDIRHWLARLLAGQLIAARKLAQ
jgi:peptidoglycan/LPS O-acetylase OafA/YrhL